MLLFEILLHVAAVITSNKKIICATKAQGKKVVSTGQLTCLCLSIFYHWSVQTLSPQIKNGLFLQLKLFTGVLKMKFKTKAFQDLLSTVLELKMSFCC